MNIYNILLDYEFDKGTAHDSTRFPIESRTVWNKDCFQGIVG